MFALIARVLVTALSLLIAATLVTDIHIASLGSAMIAAVILGLLNLLVRPVLIVLTLPITILTLGLFIFVINSFIFLFVASFVEGFTVDGFLPALIGSLIVSVVSAVANRFL